MFGAKEKFNPLAEFKEDRAAIQMSPVSAEFDENRLKILVTNTIAETQTIWLVVSLSCAISGAISSLILMIRSTRIK